MCFLDLQISKKIFQKTILSLKFKFSCQLQCTVIGQKFKFQAQGSFLEYFFGGDLKIWNTSNTFWKKATFMHLRFHEIFCVNFDNFPSLQK